MYIEWVRNWKYYFFDWYYNFLSSHQPMAQGNTKTAPRARLAHKLAKYIRANSVHIQSRLSTQNPSTTHLSNYLNNSSLRWTLKKKIKKQCQHMVPSWWWIQTSSKKEKRSKAISRQKINPSRKRCHPSFRKT